MPVETLRKVAVTRYVTPLREGGSMPAIAEADDGFLYALKFRGAGQGAKALVAELIGGLLAGLMGFRVPELVFATLDEAFGRTEPDEEIQDLLKASTGLNLALHYLSGSITFDANVNAADPLLASKILWMDNLLLNVDRTARNTNMLQWKGDTWLIDHGAALYFHHSPGPWTAFGERKFEPIRNHIFYYKAMKMDEAAAFGYQAIQPDDLKAIVALIPDVWLEQGYSDQTASTIREQYLEVLLARREYCKNFNQEALHGAR